MEDWMIPPFMLFVVLPIIIGLFYSLNESAKAHREERRRREEERRAREAQEEIRRREAEENERRWHNYYLQQLTLARQLKRSDEEIEQWARENYKTILASEPSTTAEVNLKLENWAEYMRSKPHGQEIIQFWLEPLKEIRAAKKFVAEGGEYQRRLQERLAQEELQAQVLQFRKEFAERFRQESLRQQRQRDHHAAGDGHSGRDLIPEVVEQRPKERGGFFRELLAEIKQAFGLRR